MNDSSHGSRGRAPFNGAHSIGKTDPAERFEVTFVLRRQAPEEFKGRIGAIERGDHSARISQADFVARYGASDADIAAVRAFAQRHGIALVEASPARRTVVVAGTAAQFRSALDVDFENYEHPAGTYRQRIGEVKLPAELQSVVQAVLGLDNRPQAQPHFRVHQPGPAAAAKHGAAPVSYNPPAVATAYDFPTGTGSGQCIALIELGGGYRPADLQTYFSKLGITPPPSVTAVSVDHATNAPTGSANGPDGEVMLDIEVAGSIAPGARIVAYFSPNTDAGFLNAITTAIHDTVNKPSVISISWGGPESSWEPATMTQFDEAFQSAASLGITVCVASGDNGSSDGATGNNVDFPASSPHALGCGGTSLRAHGSTITSETVWNDGTQGGASGGGVSTFFALPAYQTGLKVVLDNASTPLKMRGVPDVSGDADPETGYNVIVDGTSTQIGGTSAVAPLWAALIARANSMNGSAAGFINAELYAADPKPFHDITSGTNGAYSAATGWDACTGLGSPNGSAVAATLFKSAGQRAGRAHATAGRN
jgi:kumamolisin